MGEVTSVLVQMGALDGPPPQLEVLLIHHHLPGLLAGGGGRGVPLCGGLHVGVLSQSAALQWDGRVLHALHLLG